MIDRADILDYLKQHKAELLTQYKLSKIGIFGSFARAEQTADSDIDLIVEFQDGTENLFQLKQALRKLMEQRFHREVDICREKYIKPFYKKRILEDAIFV
jgi:predicted nucleotidyltransferase